MNVDLRDVVTCLWGAPHQRRPRYDRYFSRWRDDGRNPSFTVYATNFRDYGGDGASGDVYTFIQRELGLSFKEAKAWVEDFSGHRETTHRTASPHRPTSPHEPPCVEWQQAARQALKRTQYNLWSPQGERALNYLRRVRGLSDESIRRAGYGYNPAWMKTEWSEGDRPAYLAPGIVEPWFCDGALWALRVRCRVGNLAEHLRITPDDLPKYLNLAGSKQSGALYNADHIQPGQDVLVVEGGFDAVLAEQELEMPVVTPGSATNRLPARRLAQLAQAGRVYLLMDADNAGQQAQEKLVAALGEQVHPLTLPQGKDVTDYVVKHGGSLAAFFQRAAAWWSEGVPDTVRSALLNYFRPSTAPVIEHFNMAVCEGRLDPTCFNAQQMIDALDLSPGTVRRVLDELTGYFFAKLQTESVEVLPCKTEKKGRPTTYYAALSLQQVKQAILDWAYPRIVEAHHPTEGEEPVLAPLATPMLADIDPDVTLELPVEDRRAEWKTRRAFYHLTQDLRIDYSTPLPEGWTNVTEYRAAFLKATNDPEERRSRREIAKLLGISDRSVDKILRLAGLRRASPEGEFEIERLTTAEDLELTVNKVAREVRGFPRSVVISTEEDDIEQPYQGRESIALVAGALAVGYDVFIKCQVANRYVEMTEEERRLRRLVAFRPSTPLCCQKNVRRRQQQQQYYGPSYNPAWVTGQLRLALQRYKPYRYRFIQQEPDQWRLVHCDTGEIVDDPDAGYLLRLLLE